MTVYDTAIIGGGIQGMYQALRRTEQGENIIIVDPHEKPLQNWLKNTQNCGQKFMRSPYTHNLGRTENSLQYWRDTSQEPE